MVADELCRTCSRLENRMFKHVNQEILVGFYAADHRFLEGTNRFPTRLLECPAVGGTFDQQTVVIR